MDANGVKQRESQLSWYAFKWIQGNFITHIDIAETETNYLKSF